MRKLLPIHRVAEELGFRSETELLTILRHLPGLPYETRKGVIYADTQELGEALEERGVVVPAYLEDEPEDSDQDEIDDEDKDDAPRSCSRRR